MSDPDTCFTCRFSLDTGDTLGGKDLYHCRANPPVIPHRDTKLGAWPMVSRNAWCGKHQRPEHADNNTGSTPCSP